MSNRPSSTSSDTDSASERRQRGRELRQGRSVPETRGAGPVRPRGREVAPRRSPLRIWLPVGALVLVIVAIAGVFFFRGRAEAIPGVVTFNNLSANHTDDPVTYEQLPPVGGPHSPTWQNCGIYNQPIQSENALHSLEHGAVWITYQPDLPAEEAERLRNLVRGQTRALLSPFPGMPSRIAASAWSVQLTVESVDDPRLVSFVEQYAGGSQAPEPMATCRGGTGTPMP